MAKIIFSLSTALVLLFTTGFSQSFEGTITLTKSLNPQQSFIFSVKGDKAVMQPQVPGMIQGLKFITEKSTGEYHIVIPKASGVQKTTYPLSQPGRSVAAATPGTYQLQSQTKEIDGYTCVKVLGSPGSPFTEAWVAPSLDFVNLVSYLTPQATDINPTDIQLPGITGMVIEATGLYNGTTYTIKNTVQEGPVLDEIFLSK